MRWRGASAMKIATVLACVAFAAVLWSAPAGAKTSNNQSSPPATDFHTVVTQPGSGTPGSGGGPGANPDEPHRPVCAWQRGTASELDVVARQSGVGAQIVREDAVDHILLVYRCDGQW